MKNMFDKSGKEEKQYLCSGSGICDNNIMVWDLDNYQCIRNLTGHEQTITSLLNLKDG